MQKTVDLAKIGLYLTGKGDSMIYTDFQGKRLSLLGFGTMRLPQRPDGCIDQEEVERMVDYAMAHGINYFDTAYPYHGGASEWSIGKALKKYPRDAFYLADKFPGHQICASYDPADVFEDQLKKCGVEYFDFYLLHNVCEKSMDTYLDERWGIIDYFKEQKRMGRIRHLGFSSHGRLDFLERFLALYGGDMEFCQLQLNYLDWTLQDGRQKYELLTRQGIPVWVMEPVRGGRLAKLSEGETAALAALRPDESAAAWGFRFLQGLPNVKMILSGMSDQAQMEENVHTFSQAKPLTAQEEKAVFDIAEGMKNAIPCTACRYCCDGCPAGLDIPMLLSVYSDIRFSPSVNTAMLIDALPEDKRPSACLACGKCSKVCPQGIAVPDLMRQFTGALEKLPSWADISRQRDESQRRNRAE